MLGGTPVRPEGPPAWPLPDADVQAALNAAVASGVWGQYHGEHVCALETELTTFHQVPHAITCASGTLAVEAALRALRVNAGDEVVMAAYEYESTFLTLHAIGAKPVLVDVHPANWQLDPAKLEVAISPQTKAIICSHLHGGIVPMREVMAIARKHGVGVVEDAAQACGATVDGKPAGTWGDIGTLSFGGSKLLTAGRGGALLFNDAPLFQRAKTWLHRGLQLWAPLSELQATALRPQLRKLKEATQRRLERVQELLARLKDPTPQPPPPLGEGELVCEETRRLLKCEGSFPPSPLGGGGRGVGSSSLTPFATPANSTPAFYKLGFQYDPTSFGLPRDVFVKALRAEGIAFDAGFNAVHVGRSPSRFRAAGELPHATDAHTRCVMLHHPILLCATADAQQVADAIAKVYRYRSELTRSASPRD
jgi:perosamine synthetase